MRQFCLRCGQEIRNLYDRENIILIAYRKVTAWVHRRCATKRDLTRVITS